MQYKKRNRERPVMLRFMVSEEEEQFIEKKMALMKTKNRSAYLRKMALDGYILNIDYSAFRELSANVGKIGGNINRVAKRIATTGNAYDEDIKELREKQEEVWQLLKSTLSRIP